MKKKLVYISPDYFADVDIPVLESLTNEYHIYWIIVFDSAKKGLSKFSIESLYEIAKKNGIKCGIFVKKYRRRHPFNIFFNIKIVSEALKYKADITYIETLTDIYFSLLCFFFKKQKTILAIHNVVEHQTKEISISDRIINLSNKIERGYFKNVHLFSNSQTSVYQKLYQRRRIFTIPLFLKKFYHISGLPTATTNTFTFLTWGTLRYSKGIDFLIKAAEQLYDDGFRDFKVIIAGKTSSEWEEWKLLIKHPEIFDLYITSKLLPIEDIPPMFAQSKFMVLPYRDVTQSGPLQYALTYNLPVIASQLPGFTEYIEDGKTGFLFESEDVDSLFNAMKNALMMSNDKFDDIKANQKTFVANNVSDEHIAKKYKEMFNTVLNKPV
ncbi:glycosyltransferase involved in cell wall biosynthesis [Mucilaginibacter yixingensis]|uniref:Glycosyltransferase involved in cell wall biosynthesis n=1 Tax=Mucilaginibacter yixingensis TaxID=1295612 RepID=A0A2T5JC25_9SPHI|nr:glycosyltransferase [Mucilaginibacter yixingensis]PTQ99332.1 glycosyltransferase involved in cell wall biosynthesis [Mucilaginibacter yixingensis]